MGMHLVSCNIFMFSNPIFTFTLRKLSLSCSPVMNKYLGRQARFLNKFIGEPKKKRTFYFDNVNVGPSKGFLFKGNHGYSKQNKIRVDVLNKLFMKYISEILITGHISSQDIMEKGLLISKVEVTPPFHHVNVYWVTNKPEKTTELEATLPQLAFSLRHELSQLRVMGIVPRIVFVKDKNYNDALKVEYLLKIADFGEEFEPLPLESDFKNLLDIENPNMKTIKVNNPSLSDEESAVEELILVEEQLPVMRHDTFNLSHDHIMMKITKKFKKSRALHRFHPDIVIDCEGGGSIEDEKVQMTKQERKTALSKFILQRKILHEKQKENKHKSDRHIINYELEDDEYDEYKELTVEDYIEEDLENEHYRN